MHLKDLATEFFRDDGCSPIADGDLVVDLKRAKPKYLRSYAANTRNGLPEAAAVSFQ